MQKRMNKLIQERIHDPYYEDKKYPEGTVCPGCGAICEEGRWVWPEDKSKKSNSEEEILCPACKRIRDKYPAGIVSLSGSYLWSHKEEILNLVNNIIEEERKRSPLKRLINIEERDGAIVLSFTNDKLARRVGESIYRAHKGEIDIKYPEEEKFVSVFWHRDEESKEEIT